MGGILLFRTSERRAARRFLCFLTYHLPQAGYGVSGKSSAIHIVLNLDLISVLENAGVCPLVAQCLMFGGARVGGAAVGHNVDGGQNEGISVGAAQRLHWATRHTGTRKLHEHSFTVNAINARSTKEITQKYLPRE